jgi:hypothetical protein
LGLVALILTPAFYEAAFRFNPASTLPKAGPDDDPSTGLVRLVNERSRLSTLGGGDSSVA